MKRRTKTPRAQVTYWQSFSDMMSALLLMFVLLMAFVMFRSADTYEKKQLEIEQQRVKLSEQEALLDAQADTLALTQEQLDEKQALLEGAQERLEHQTALLGTQQSLLDKQQSKLASQQNLLVEQQMMIEDMIGVRTRLIKQITSKLKEAGIDSQVDPVTGAITFGSNVLFDYNKANLTAEGKTFLAQFLPVYFSALLDSGFDDYVSEIIIEGHTDTSGNYMYNLDLSQQRAFAVASFCLDEKNNVTNANTLAKLRKIVTANGRSMSSPVYNADGTVNMDASRRVEIKFRLKDEEIMNQMKSVIGG